jgi:hypothetical protein
MAAEGSKADDAFSGCDWRDGAVFSRFIYGGNPWPRAKPRGKGEEPAPSIDIRGILAYSPVKSPGRQGCQVADSRKVFGRGRSSKVAEETKWRVEVRNPESLRLTAGDIEQIRARGSTPARIMAQIEMFRKGFPYTRLLRPCTVGDGIHMLRQSDIRRLADVYTAASLEGRAMKFVPASGAATRMLKALLSVHSRYGTSEEHKVLLDPDSSDPDVKTCTGFILGISQFAFYEDLKKAMARDGLNMDSLMSSGSYGDIITYALTAKGLNLADTPKGLIKFHRYPDVSRTSFEEHLVEGAAYVRDRTGRVRLHFTVSQEHEEAFRDHLGKVRKYYEKGGVTFDVQFSVQKPSTDTIAVDLDNRPFRDTDGSLVFRPGGHGALLENLNELKGDIVFVKNIDNVVPDRLKEEVYTYKKALGGYLVQLQDRIFSYLKRIRSGDDDKRMLKEAIDFSSEQLCTSPAERSSTMSKKEMVDFLTSTLNRPLRVCGMVRNVGEPGGGPFWVDQGDKRPSLQIVESSQVDMGSKDQEGIWKSATHFNPVDLVCGVRGVDGSPFDLRRFTDPDTGLISTKSKDGRELKALELPGLWNGAMANWITVFVEVPLATFAPVKTIVDLLREEHQPA